MKIITVAGKVDSRPVVYPLARALSLVGQTAIVSDDGAYHRLYRGKSLKGTVSGVDISIGLNMDEDLKNSLSRTGVKYDYMIVVSSNYIPKETDGLLLCHGVDNSMMQEIEEEKPEEEKEPAPKKKGLFGRKKDDAEEEVLEASENDGNAEVPDILVEENEDDTFEFDSNIPNKEIYISYNKPLDKYAQGILLKEGFVGYVYGCEEQKELQRLDDKAVNKQLASLFSDLLDIDSKELYTLLNKLEYNKEGKKK